MSNNRPSSDYFSILCYAGECSVCLNGNHLYREKCITDENGNYTNNHLRTSPKEIRTTNIVGYLPAGERYHPDYIRCLFWGEKDYQRALYWNPDIQMDNLGCAQASFYNEKHLPPDKCQC